MNYFAGFEQAYPQIIGTILEKGKRITPRAGSSIGETLEICPYEFVIPSTRPVCRLKARKLSPLFLFLEPFYLFTTQQSTDIVGALSAYAPNLKKLALNEKTGKFDGNYGDRIHLMNTGDQMLRIYKLLKQDIHSRRAVLTIHNPVWDIVDSESKDIPCTLSLQFLFREGMLDCYCTMRSNDVWYGTPHNVMMFTFLQRALAGWLSVPTGLYHHRANSFHLYTALEQKAKDFVDASTVNPDYWEKYDIPELIEYPMSCASIAALETDATAVIERERLYRTMEGPPERYPILGEYMITLFDLLTAFWADKRDKEGRDISPDFRHNKDIPLHNDPTATTP